MNATESATQQTNHTAYLSAENGFTVFEYGTTRIRFRTPYSLERYTDVKQWDNGYLVVYAEYRHNAEPEEEYIDLAPVLADLYIDADQFLRPIRKVEIAQA